MTGPKRSHKIKTKSNLTSTAMTIPVLTRPIKKPLRVMKFGGTSVGDAACIRKVVEIIRGAVQESSVAVVVSAMAGVTNRLIEAANQAQAGNKSMVAEILAHVGKRHDEALRALIHTDGERRCLQRKLYDLLSEGERSCQSAILSGQLTPRILDAIAGLGERLSAPLVAAALAEAGAASEAVEATELLVTDSCHGGAEPWMEPTRTRCEERLLPLLRQGTVPVITGFIGASDDGILTTLGRGGSDYSASIFGAALEADEVVIWSDVPGMLTADPKLVAEAAAIAEISYHEAAELAYFVATVLHPKTLRPLVERGIPVWIKSTFHPGEAGTKITPNGTAQIGVPATNVVPIKVAPVNVAPASAVNGGRVKALAAMHAATLIRIAGGAQSLPQPASNALPRALAAVAAVRANLLVLSGASGQSEPGLVIPSAMAGRAIEALRREFCDADAPGWTVTDSAVSIVTLVGQNLRIAPATVAWLLAALEKENVSVIATGHGASECSMSFVVPPAELRVALSILHRELQLNATLIGRHTASPARPAVLWEVEPERASAD